MDSKNHFDKLIVVFGVLFTGVTLMSVGAKTVEKNPDVANIAIGLLTALFWLGIVALTLWSRFATLKDKLEAERRDNQALRSNGQNTVAAAPPMPGPTMPPELKKVLDDIVSPIMDDLKEMKHDHDMLQAIFDDMGYHDEKPADDKLPEIEAAFHENTDRYVRLTPDPEDGKIAVEFSDKPFVPGRSDAHEAARLRGDASRAADATKPLTKSQQRRINAKKGLGALTDDEVREKKNAERRAKRAAKKAEAEKSTNAPLPGQTELVPPESK